jgi:ribosomal protein S18 acetylase RimI-like enzyme
MDDAAVLAAFDDQVRQNTAPDGTGAACEADGRVVRRLAPPGQDGSGINWSDLDAACANAVIAAQVALFAERGEQFEWKLYSYDRPADLAVRLRAAGFVAGEPESLMIAEVADVIAASAGAHLPAGVRLEPVTEATRLDKLTRVHEIVFGTDESARHAALVAQLAAAPEVVGLVVAVAGSEPVAASRIEFVPGTQFAGLWGGGTLPQWRGRGIYRAMVRHRAELAAGRGCRYLTVDASDQSRPILERVGFRCLATTTPFTWSPA